MRERDDFKKAVKNLKEIIKIEPPYSVIEQAGAVMLFELAFELSWKLMKKVLENYGYSAAKTGSPLSIIRLSYSAGIIKDEAGWIALLKTRNLLIHTYSDEFSKEAIDNIKGKFFTLFQDLEKEIETNWK